MSKTIKLTYYGIEAEGATVKEAKLAAGREIEHIIAQIEESPVYIEVCGVSALVAFGRWGWGHRLLRWNNEPIPTGSVPLGSGYRTKREAEVRALAHVIDTAWNFPPDDSTWLDSVLAGKPGVYLSAAEARTLRGELLYRWDWQRRVRAAREQGYDDEDARHIASGLTHLVKRHPAATTTTTTEEE